VSVTINLSGLDEISQAMAAIDLDALCFKIASSLKEDSKAKTIYGSGTGEERKVQKIIDEYIRDII
jgi:hypothetical protein